MFVQESYLDPGPSVILCGGPGVDQALLVEPCEVGVPLLQAKSARWVEDAVICWLEMIPPSMPSGPEHSGEKQERMQMRASMHMYACLFSLVTVER